MRENADQNNSEYGHFLRSDEQDNYICWNWDNNIKNVDS